MDDVFSLERSVFHVSGAGPIRAATNEAAFWAVRDRAELTSGHVVSVFGYRATWDFQERHPDGDELAAVLEGDVDLLLDRGAGETAVRVTAGCAGIVPAGAWHRVAVRVPSTILFVTPAPVRTEHRPVT